MTKSLWFLVLFLVSTIAVASSSYYPDPYQRAFNDNALKNDDLKQALFDVLSKYHVKVANQPDTLADSCQNTPGECYRHNVLGYTEAKKFLFQRFYLTQNGTNYSVTDVYCDRVFDEENAGVGPNKIPTDSVLNCEHSWPQSKFTGRFPTDMQRSDLHHLYPSDSKENGLRGNFPFAEVRGDKTMPYCPQSRLGKLENTDQTSHSLWYFEPNDTHKGKVARAVLYFSIRYQVPISDEEEYFLKKWHRDYPVDAEEQRRNDAIYAEQKNRNPFIDFPNLVDDIDNF